MSEIDGPIMPRDGQLSVIERDQLLREIYATFRSMPETIKEGGLGNSNTVWTRQVVRDFKQLGYKWGYWVCPDPNQMTGAWLYDVSWYRTNGYGHAEGYQVLVEVSLVLESEWSRHWADIRYDFEKLLQAKAGIKVMVFEQCDETVEVISEKLVASIRAFGRHDPDECYVLAGFNHDPRGFEVRIIRDPTNPSSELLVEVNV